MSRPSVSPALAADITAKLPSRVARKLDAEPALAEAWRWSEADGVWSVEGGETVTLRARAGALDTLDDIGCTCLLAPRCLHIAAVVARLPIAAATPAAADGAAAVTGEGASLPEAAAPDEAASLTPAQAEAARRASETLAEVLAAGVDALGALRRGQLLRALHEARATGLHRLGRALLRVIELGRDLRAGAPELALDDLVDALRDGLASAAMLLSAPSAVWIGSARRDFEALSGRVLHGLFVEPVITASGYAGTVTWLVDNDGRLFSVGNVMPGPPERAALAYGSGLGLGGIGTPASEIARTGVFWAHGRASSDGRLGGGQEVQAAPAAGRSSLFCGPVARLWDDKTTAAGFAFADLRLGVPGPDGVTATIIDGPDVLLVADSDHPALAYVDNLRVLGRATGHVVRAILRVLPRRPRVLAPLVISCEAARWPDAWAGRACLGFEHLSPAMFAAVAPMVTLALAPPPRPAPLEPLRRRVVRLLLGGRATLPEGIAAQVAREARALEAAFLPTAATLLRELHTAALVHTRGFTGERRAAHPELLARAWLRAATYLAEAERT